MNTTPIPESFTPVPASQNPFLVFDPDYVERLVEARGLAAEARDPFVEEQE